MDELDGFGYDWDLHFPTVAGALVELIGVPEDTPVLTD